ncbi:MAG: S49 family peptidase [Parvularculaceae bacterium]
MTVIEMTGAIGETGAGRKGLTLKRLEKSIEAAFKPGNLKAVALAINSPGGSPVQSRLILSAVRRAAAEKNIPVIAFIEDVGASGGYILALAADEIYADESSIVGSIGVIAGGFGFQEAIEKLGVERRVHTAGENKSMLDPFKPEDPKDVERLETLLARLHRQFIDLVKERRGGKLSDNPDLFTGAFWSGEEAVQLGLIDGCARLGEFLRDRHGKDVRIRRVSPEGGPLWKKLMSGEAAPLIDPDDLIAAAGRRSLWARFGL